MLTGKPICMSMFSIWCLVRFWVPFIVGHPTPPTPPFPGILCCCMWTVIALSDIGGWKRQAWKIITFWPTVITNSSALAPNHQLKLLTGLRDCLNPFALDQTELLSFQSPISASSLDIASDSLFYRATELTGTLWITVILIYPDISVAQTTWLEGWAVFTWDSLSITVHPREVKYYTNPILVLVLWHT